MEILAAIFWFVVFPIADFKHVVGQIEHLYLARTFDHSLFKTKKKGEVPSDIKNTSFEIEVNSHYEATLTACQKFNLFCATKMKCCLCWICCFGHK